MDKGNSYTTEPPDLGLATVTNAILALPRGAKRLIMAGADAVMLPLALWAALVLKFDSFSFDLGRYADLFIVATLSALVIFAVLGLYRAIIRFMGLHAMATVVAGVAVSVVALEGYDRVARSEHVPLSVLAIYAALALVYLASSRFIIRYMVYYKRTAARPSGWPSTAPESPARGCPRPYSGVRILRPWPLSTTSALCTAAGSTASRSSAAKL